MKKIIMSLLLTMTASAAYAGPEACADSNTYSSNIDVISAVYKVTKHMTGVSVKTDDITFGSLRDATKLQVHIESEGKESTVTLGSLYAEMIKDKLSDLYQVSERSITCKTEGWPGILSINCIWAKN